MERKHRLLTVLFILIAILSVSGFYHSYIGHFPKLGDFYFVTHIHLLLFLCWFAMLIAQPILIRKGKIELHRKLGKLSYFLAPMIVISILALVINALPKNYAESPEQAAVLSVGGILDTILFSVCYMISMYTKRNLRWHVAFIIGASLVILNPGLGRLISNLANNDIGILTMVFTPYVTSISILIFEKIKFSRPILKSPYLLFAGLWTIELALFIILPGTSFWKGIMLMVISKS